MSAYNRRIIHIGYFGDRLPQFNTQEEIDEWHRAIGRMVTYRMRRDSNEDAVEFVSAGVSLNPVEFCATYYSTFPAQAEKYADGAARYVDSNAHVADQFIDAMVAKSKEQGRPFTMAAVLHSDGKWGFHS